MLINRSHRKWFVFTLAAACAALAYYAYYANASRMNGGTGPTGATWTGIVYGILGFGLMIFCGLLGARRKVRVWRLGRAETWLKAHIWLGLLAFPLILCHSGMMWGNNLTLWLMIIFVIVELSGILGVVLQNLLPKTMLEQVKAETTFEQIPYVIGVLHDEAKAIVSAVCGPLEAPAANEAEQPAGVGEVRSGLKTDGRVQGKEVKHKGKNVGPLEGSLPLKNFYLDEVKPFLVPKYFSGSNLATPQRAEAVFLHAKTLLPDTLHEALNDLKSVCEERRQLAIQERLHRWLHLWEYVHIPLSYLLLSLSLFHVIKSTFWYSGILNK